VLVVGPVAADMQKAFDLYWKDLITVDLDQLTDVRENLFNNGEQVALPALTFPAISEFDELIERVNSSTYITREFIATAHAVTDIEFTADPPQKPFLDDKEAIVGTSEKLRQLIEGAEHSVLMQTPYFIISSPAYKALKDLRKKQPDIKYTVSTNSLASVDHYIVYALSLKRKKRNVKNLGFNIYELKPAPGDILEMMPRYSKLSGQKGSDAKTYEYDPEEPIDFERYETVPVETQGPRISIHSKSLLVDGKTAVIGSHNFDPRGVAINTEVTLMVKDKDFANELSKSIDLVMQPQNSWIIARRQRVPLVGHITEVLETFSRMLPVFDLWPFRYTTSFELREGMQPVSVNDLDFYNHYEDVGQFPGTALSDDQLKTLLVSGFGAVAEPFM
jgi:phosphatidylserine/phosphatidylglycerophosphate/cardiolipin synthase-like enzyme